MDSDYNIKLVLNAQNNMSGELDKVKSQVSWLWNQVEESMWQSTNAFKQFWEAIVWIWLLEWIKKVWESVITLAWNLEQAQVSFWVMLWSADAAKQMLSDLSDFAQKTPFQLPEVRAWAKQLMAFGISAKDVIPDLKMLWDVSAGLNVPLSQLEHAFGQVAVGGKLTWRELNEFVMAGVPIIATLSKNLWVSQAAIKDMVSTGEIWFPAVKKAFETMSSAGWVFANMMDKQSKTMQWSFSNLQDTFTRLWETIWTVFIPVLTQIINNIIPVVSAIWTWATANKWLAASFWVTLAAWGAFLSLSLLIWPVFAGIVLAVWALSVAFATNFWWIRDITVWVFTEVSAFLSETRSSISTEWNWFLDDLWLTNSDVRNGIKDVISVVRWGIKLDLSMTFEVIKWIIVWAREFVTTYTHQTFEWIRNIIKWVTQAIKSALAWDFSQMFAWIKQAFWWVEQVITAPFYAARNAIVWVVNGMIWSINKLIDSINSLWSSIGIQLPNIKKIWEETIKASAGRAHDIEWEKKALQWLLGVYNTIKNTIAKWDSAKVVKWVSEDNWLLPSDKKWWSGKSAWEKAMEKEQKAAEKLSNELWKLQEKAKADTFKLFQDAGQKAFDWVATKIWDAQKSMAWFDLKIVDAQKKFSDMQASMSKDIQWVDSDIRSISEESMKDLSVRSVEVTKNIADLQKQLTWETDQTKIASIQNDLTKAQEEQSFLMSNTTEEARKQATAYDAMSKSQQVVFDNQKAINDLQEKQNIMKAFQSGTINAWWITTTWEGKDQKTFYKDSQGQLKEITDLKNAQYAQDLLTKQQASIKEIKTLQDQKDQEALVLKWLEDQKSAMLLEWGNKLQINHTKEMQIAEEMRIKYLEVENARQWLSGWQANAPTAWSSSLQIDTNWWKVLSVTDAKSLQKAMSSVASAQVRKAVNDPYGAFAGKAVWWPVSGWTPYIVGEKWPELFVPTSNWSITPNNKLGNQSININMGWVTVREEADIWRIADALARKIQLQRNYAIAS